MTVGFNLHAATAPRIRPSAAAALASKSASIKRAEAQDCAAILNELLHGIQPGVGSPGRAVVLQNIYNQNCNGNARPAEIPRQFTPQGNKYWQPQAPAQSDQTDDAQLRAAQENVTAELYKQLDAFEKAYQSLQSNRPLSNAVGSPVTSFNPPVGYADKFANQSNSLRRGFNFPAHRNLRVSEGVENLLR